MVSFSEIQNVSSEIEEKFHPDKIVLLRSYAYGNPGPADSCVDLLVAMRSSVLPVDHATKIRNMVDFPFPVDHLVCTPEQIELRLALGDGFIREVTSRGKLL